MTEPATNLPSTELLANELMPEFEPPLLHNPTSYEKASVILAAMGPELAAQVLNELGEDNMRTFARTISGMGRIPSTLVDQVVTEFFELLGVGDPINGGPLTARKILAGAMDEEQLSAMMDDVSVGRILTIWDKLGNAPLGNLAAFLANEHPQIGAVVLSKLRSDKAARVLERLPPEVAQVIVLRMTKAMRLDGAVVRQVSQVMESEFLSVVQQNSQAKKPAEVMAGLMNHVSGASRDEFLAQLDEADPAFSSEVQRVMFTFADIPARVMVRDISVVMRAVEEDVLMTALKTGTSTDPKSVEFMLDNVSKRLSERMREDLDAMLDVPLKEGESAQAEVIKAIQALAQRGEIKLNQTEAPEDD